MFEPSATPRVFALPPGADFPRGIVQWLTTQFEARPPEALARVTLFVNTRRMQRRMIELFDEGRALLLPRIRLISDLAQDIAFGDMPPAVSPLRRRLELSNIIARLLDANPDLAPRSAIFSLADSLATLLDEMHSEGVSPKDLHEIDVSDISGHWQRSLTFIDAVSRFFSADNTEPPGIEARQRQVIERLADIWRTDPPRDPVIVAGSTGSRGATLTFMKAVAALPLGALVLPGFDTAMPAYGWARLNESLSGEDHPQFRFAQLMRTLGIDWSDVQILKTQTCPNARRNDLVSLALRPAPVTDQWKVEGPAFAGTTSAAADMALIEAPSRRIEAVSIALILREAAESGTTAALITPDRSLARQVTAALDRWRIEPDDSAGRPLLLTAPGRFLRHIADLTGTQLTASGLLALLKHPLTGSGGDARGEHLRHTRDFELQALRGGLPYPDPDAVSEWARMNPDRTVWASWLSDILQRLAKNADRPLQDHLADTLDLAKRLLSGPDTDEASIAPLWEKPAGREAKRIVGELLREAPHGGVFSHRDYRDLLVSVLARGEVRDPIKPHPGIRIWGTLEARVQGADLAILAGLNEGTWPQSPAPDPWMNRRMRHDAGLLLPERRIGLSAHDFQQAIGAKRVVLSRALRDTESATVPSRWLNRLTNLMQGMSQEGETALADMRARGEVWIHRAEQLDTAPPEPPAPRPSPMPPVAARPRQLSVTRITTLVRDPYAIYAEKVLRLRALKPLHQSPDAPLRGTLLHKIFERFIAALPPQEDRYTAHQRLTSIARDVLDAGAPWPAARLLWLAQIDRLADCFLTDEAARQSRATPVGFEVHGNIEIQSADFTLTGTADRIDRDETGTLLIYDYKSGRIPTKAEREHIDKQLYLEAVMAQAGAFEGIPPARVSEVGYIGLGASAKFERIPITPDDVTSTRLALTELIGKYNNRNQGYTARRLAETRNFGSDFDHLSRFGEWDHTTSPRKTKVGE